MISTDRFQSAVESRYGAAAALAQSVYVNECDERGMSVWEGVVHVFDLKGYAAAKRAYALRTNHRDWNSPITTLLHDGSIAGPVEAVRTLLWRMMGKVSARSATP